MSQTCFSCKSELDALPAQSDPNLQVVFCLLCEKKFLSQGHPPTDVELHEGDGSLLLVYRVSRRQLAWVTGIMLLLMAVSIILWVSPSNKWTETGALLSSMFTVVLLLLVVGAFFWRGRLKVSFHNTHQGGAPFRGEHPSTAYSFEISHSTVFRRQESVLAESILQVFCMQERQQSLEGRTSYVYHVQALLTGGRVVTLMQGILSLETARYLEAKIESFLRIPDVKIPEEAS